MHPFSRDVQRIILTVVSNFRGGSSAMAVIPVSLPPSQCRSLRSVQTRRGAVIPLNETWGDQYRRWCRACERLQTAGAEVSDRDVDPRDVVPAFCNEALAPMYWVQNGVVGHSLPDSDGSATGEISPLPGRTTANTSLPDRQSGLICIDGGEPGITLRL
jgi:hypothetical protein